MARTKKPCPGCGESGERDADKVCGDCARKLIEADQIIAANAAWMFDKQQAGDTAMTPTVDYSWERPWPKMPGRISGWSSGKAPERLGKLLARLALAVSRPGHGYPKRAPNAGWDQTAPQGPAPREVASFGKDFAQWRAFPPGVVDLLTELQAAIADGLGECAWTGYEAGHNLLGALHRGELSEAEFHRQAAGEGIRYVGGKSVYPAEPKRPIVARDVPPPPPPPVRR